MSTIPFLKQRIPGLWRLKQRNVVLREINLRHLANESSKIYSSVIHSAKIIPNLNYLLLYNGFFFGLAMIGRFSKTK